MTVDSCSNQNVFAQIYGFFWGMCDRAIGRSGDRAIGLRKVDIISTRRLKPRLDKRSPPPWTKKNYLQPTEVGFACVDAVSTAVSSLFVKNPVSGVPPPNKETGFLPKSMGCNEVFRKKPGFWGHAIDFFG
ncbi:MULTISPECIES: hypothetical protein [unclassified Microcoleus]|uniref:hypothetical protein n=1 Tax=unclassified Microcoleus TaxID=2642155 RepID=UPI002FD5D88C